MPNPFAKTRPVENPYAIYIANGFTFHVCKTYKMPKHESKDAYARWFVWAKSPMTYDQFEGGDTYRNEIIRSARLVACDPQWLESMQEHGFVAHGHKVPTVAAYATDKAQWPF